VHKDSLLIKEIEHFGNTFLIMKIIIHCFIVFSSIGTIAAQNVGIGTTTPAASAQLEVSSTTKGFLPPRMDSTARNAIVAPAAGLTIYNSSINAFQVYNGTAWYSTVHYIGESYGGGIVFYTYDNGQHGLIAATVNQSSGIAWYTGTNGLNPTTRAKADGVGAGSKNTALIIAVQGPGPGGDFAATICNDYSVIAGGVTYGDWYLPSKHELRLLYNQRAVVGGFITAGYYWSSTEVDINAAWFLHFIDGVQLTTSKTNTAHVRAIRSF